MLSAAARPCIIIHALDPQVVVTILMRIAGLVLGAFFAFRVVKLLVAFVFGNQWLLPGDSLFYTLLNITLAALGAAGGAYCFLSGRWLIKRLLRGLHEGKCPQCGYDIRGLAPGDPCPECGAMHVR